MLSLLAACSPRDKDKSREKSFQIETVQIPSGLFLMGSSDGSNVGNINGSGLNTGQEEPGRIDSYEKQHAVLLTKSFSISKYEITNVQYAEFLNLMQVECNHDDEGNAYGSNTSIYEGKALIYTDNQLGVLWDQATMQWKSALEKEEYPAINVSWYGAVAFAEWVEGDLPTEAQWEYACRGGQSASLPFGIGTGLVLDYTMANFAWSWSYDWDGYGLSAREGPTGGMFPYSTQQVGLYQPNGYGLYDMHGNVSEWCTDSWDSSSNYPDEEGTSMDDPIIDPIQTLGHLRIIRGGSYYIDARNCRSACRRGDHPIRPSYSSGFRVVFNGE
ncbi:MAG: formylglycine-generating enzyme family protein [Prevotellaceae bacterium]|nr:formylglycine-generating enzyme family protein [Prevotellaceae bacterium]